MRRHLLLTFDYELFLGKCSGSVERCLLQPTAALSRVLAQHSALAVFFVDTAWLLRLGEAAQLHDLAKRDLDAVQAQLRSLRAQGHEVFPHLHPHWLDAIYISSANAWDLTNARRYRFHSLEERTQRDLFDSSMGVLRDTLGDSAKLDGFRAGGLSIQPFSAYEPHFKRHGITFDLSVMPGTASWTTAQVYDFLDAPAADAWRFDTQVMSPDSRGNFVQIPASCIKWTGLRRLLEQQWKRVHRRTRSGRRWGDGVWVMPEHLPPPSCRVVSAQASEALSIDSLNTLRLSSYLRHMDRMPLSHYISHPKLLSSHALTVFRRLLHKACKRYDVRTSFRELAAVLTELPGDGGRLVLELDGE